MKTVKPDEHSGQYCAQVYYTTKLREKWYYCHIVVTKDLEMCLAVSKYTHTAINHVYNLFKDNDLESCVCTPGDKEEVSAAI